MHYRNGREAKNGDMIVQLEGGKVAAVGMLRNAVAENDYCNGEIVINSTYLGPGTVTYSVGACLCDCLRVDDVAAILAEKGLDNRPEGK